MHYLYENNYISSFLNNVEGYLKNNELVDFSFDLTKEGYENIDKIIEAFFATVNNLKNNENLEELLINFESLDKSIFINREETSTVFPTDIDNLLRAYYLFGPENMLGCPVELQYDINRVKEILEELSVKKSFIFIDSPEELNSKYFTSDEILFTKNYKIPYRMNKISDEHLEFLGNIATVDNFAFKARSINQYYTKLEGTSQKPCYEDESIKCENAEYDPNSNEEYIPFEVKNEDNVLSLMKIDRSFGIPFVKGYIQLNLDETKVSSENSTFIYYYLLLQSFNYKFSFSDLREGGTIIEILDEIAPRITITFSTYNDLSEEVITFIKDFFENPIDESTFNSMKETYILSLCNNNENTGIQNIFSQSQVLYQRFLSADTLEESFINKNNIREADYSNFTDIFNNVTNIITDLKYLTHGDISLELAQKTTDELSNLINRNLDINLKLSEKKIEIPENTSVLFSYISKDIYQRQGGVLVRYEFDEELYNDMTIYSYCAYSFFFDYLRTQRFTGYNVRVATVVEGNKLYLQLFCIGKTYSPEKMDRLINEAIVESFKFDKCQTNDVVQHFNNKYNTSAYYAGEKFAELLN